MAGLASILKSCGEMTFSDENGSVTWGYDYVKDMAVIKSETIKPKKHGKSKAN
jgi:hypothetical protein